MARQYFPWCPCCAQCTNMFDFQGYSGVRWEKVDDPSGSTPISAAHDPITDLVTLSGEGSVTMRVTPNPKAIYVAAKIPSLTSGKAGVTIRRVDSAESISLWWMGGTSYELRHGSTVLESITGSGSDEIKLELTTPRDATTDVLVYIGGTLAHTETGVAFVMPDVLHLGMIVAGEADFEWVEMSPCPSCVPIVLECHGGKPMPAAWKLAVAGLSGEEVAITMNTPGICEDSSAPATLDYCDWFNDDYFLVPRSHAPFNGFNIHCYDLAGGEWYGATPGIGDCVYVSVFPMRNVPRYSVPVPDGFAGQLTKSYCAELGSTISNICYYPTDGPMFESDSGNPSPAVMLEVFHDPINSTMRFQATLSYHIEDLWPFQTPGLHAVYESADMADTTDFLSTSITLNKQPSSYGCTNMPASLTLEPNSEDTWGLIQQLSKCGQTCTPPVTPQPGVCYLINLTLADEDGGVWDYSLPLGLQYDEDSGSWYWEGGSLSAYPYIHDTCGPLPEFDIKIHCVEPGEGALKQWVLDFTTSGGSDRYPMAWFDVEETIPEFEGTTDLMCSGQTWDLYAFNLRLETTEYQFGSCSWSACETPTSPIILADISASCSGESGSGGASGPLVFQASSSLPVGVDPGDVSGLSFWSPLPSSLNTGILKMAFLYVENGTAKIQITDGAGNPIPDMDTTVSYSCDPSDGKPAFVDTSETLYDWGFPGPYTANQFGLCDGESSGFGGWEVTFP